MQQIMVATDGSDSADRAVDVAAELAAVSGGALQIVNVAGSLPEEAWDELKRNPAMERLVGDAIDVRSQAILAGARRRALSRGAKDVRTQQFWGDVTEKILEASQTMGVDTLVVGRRGHGHGRLAALLLGSVSQKLASLSPCAVVVVP
ncbi:MAG TPA: universal stress protein [Rhodopila sp.]